MLTEAQRANKLRQLAAEDEIYQIWQNSFLEVKAAFDAFAATQPTHIRSILYGYADCGRMAMQRQVILACKMMRFPEEE